ncbi:hypothetical protein OJ996_15625 [Luteolibacter sp. GHJ8]|uniref:Tetratricopeptide repeat protein n=1 Tax=Luteolibacter rhizosphaerae TaxID=2989719 RepID=A0ABT3G681_9BACT|nr:hypothetical protein [Luteolibacter rhizosphaerae]MCW1915016.1 hypothetical protein [Luteolibacter rhizosphaerae]
MKRRVLLLTPLLIACGPFFYQAPPPLESYPQRIPGKGWSEVLEDFRPLAPDAAKESELIESCVVLIGELPSLGSAECQARIDGMIARNREGVFSARIADLLNEFRELAADDSLSAPVATYLTERIEQIRTGSADATPAPVRNWNQTPDEFAQAVEDHRVRQEAVLTRMDLAMKEAPPALLPNYGIRRARYLFDCGDYASARAAFADAAVAFPRHPRVEIARFMVGRCLLESMRKQRAVLKPPGLGSPEMRKLHQEVVDSFQAYLTQYPQGRFVPDAYGWLAAAEVEVGNHAAAVELQLQRLESRPSREIFRSVLRECDGLFAALLAAPDASSHRDFQGNALPWRTLAKYPEVARIFVYQALDPLARSGFPDPHENFTSDASTLDFLHRRVISPRRFTKSALKQLGAAVAGVPGNSPDPFILLVLGWASIMEDEPGQALVLFGRALANRKSDDLLQGRAVALTALGRHREAAAAYGELMESFPASILAKPAGFDRATARYRGGEAGEAFLDMLGLVSDSYSEDAGPRLHPEFEPRQWLDSIAQFAPLDELAKPLERLAPEEDGARLLRAVVRGRAMAVGRFDLARRHLDPPRAEDDRGWISVFYLPDRLHLDEAAWEKDVAPLAAALQRLQQGDGNEAALQLEVGRAWKAARGRLTLPLQQLFDYARSEGEKLDLLRRRNAAFLRIPADAVVKELDSRDELHHALRHFLAAADLSKDPAIVAPALEEANEALFRLAEFSEYRLSRAIETDAAALSARAVERLRHEFADRAEAGRAISWTFTPPIMLGRWMPGDYNAANSAEAILASVASRQGASEQLLWSLSSLTARDGRDIGDIRRTLREWRADFARKRPGLETDEINRIGDDLDDLSSAALAPGITIDLFQRYAELRLSRGVPPAAEGEWKPLAAHLAFLDRIREVENEDGWMRPNGNTIASWEEYLRMFPNGPKSRSASFRLLRLKVREIAPIPQVRAFFFPEAPIPGGYKHLLRPSSAVPEKVAALEAELAAHAARYPDRYVADLAMLRAALAAHRGDYTIALENLSSVLADPDHPELRMDAALYFSEISLRILDLSDRASVMDAFRKAPAAMPWLEKLVNGDTCLSRLRPLMPCLDQS